MKQLKTLKLKVLAITLLIIVAINGCTNARSPKQSAESKTKPKKTVQKDLTDSAEEVSEYQYLELTEIKDSYGDGAMYPVYAPKGYSNENDLIYYSDHGLTFLASAMELGSNEYLIESLEYSVEFTEEEWTDDNSEFRDVEISEMLENGEDRYQIISAEKEDLYGTPYEVNHIYYLNIQEDGCGVFWDLELYEANADSKTDFIIDELAKCYHVDLDVIKADGAWAAANEERLAQEKELGQEDKTDSLPETILWFNATYAPLTYNNGLGWEVVGGMEPSESNTMVTKFVLDRDWGIEDESSAMETVESLKENGHRAKCRECMEELEKLGILEEKSEEVFLESLLNSGIEENLYRYVIAYQLHRSGLDADYIAAWDLCRVNQLYADFYICGYMTYEEAMDASLENSLILQKMYSSWDDLVTSYMAGYQFWRSDPMLTDDSPTRERYQCYLDLLKMEDGPYTLDWNLELEKSW